MKNQIRKVFLVILSLTLIAFFASSCGGNEKKADPSSNAGGGEKKTVVLRLVLASPAGDEMTIKDEEFAKRFNERAGGAYEIKVYPGGTLGKVPEFLDSVRTGAIEMMDAAPPIYGGADIRLSATMYPFLFKNGKAIDAAQSDLEALYDPIFQEKFNQKLLNHYYVGAFDLLSAKKQIKTLEDIKGVLLGAGDPVIVAIAEQMGAVPINVPWTDFFTSLDKGVVDGVLQQANGAIATGTMDAVKHYTDLQMPPGTDVFTINLDVWKAMPKDIQDILVEEAQKVARETSAHYIQQHEKDLEIIKSMGITINLLTDAEREKIRAACMPYTEKKLAELGDFGKKLKEIADKANSKS